MKIVYFIDHLRPDGTQQFLAQLSEGMARRGHTQTVVCLNASYDHALVGRISESGTNVRIVGKLSLLSGIGVVATTRWLIREKFDVAVTLLFTADVIGRTLARIARVPRVVSSIRARNVNYAWWQRWLVRHTMRWADTVVVNARSVCDWAVHEEGAKAEATTLIPNGVSVDDFAHPISRADFRREFSLDPDCLLIGSVGRLTSQKGFSLLLDAFARLPRRDAHLIIAGEGEEERRLRGQVRALQVGSRVHFVGYRRDLPRWLGALDVYVQSSVFEGMPNAVLEAMASGCPVVATAVDGACDLIEDGRSGWLVLPGDSNRLAHCMLDALNDPAARQARAASAQARARTDFSTDAVQDAWERVLDTHMAPDRSS